MRVPVGIVFGGLIALCLVPPGSFAAEAAQHWVATSTTAMAITGNVTVSATKMVFQNGRTLELSLVGPVPGFKVFGDPVDASLYRVTKPADLLLNNGNHLCGGGRAARPVSFIVVWTPPALPGDKAPRSMAAFSGKDQPHSTSEPTSCGTYTYDAGI